MCSGCGSCGVCKAVAIVMLILVSVLTLAAAIGLYNVHVMPDGLVFGTMEGSLSIIALFLCLMGWKKLCRGACGCGKGCGCGCGGKCGGACPGCGNSPCTCKKTMPAA